MIKVIAFDYGGVIEVIEKKLMQQIADYLKITKEDWMKAYFSLNYLCNTGKNTYEEVYALVAKKFNASDNQISDIHKMMKKNRTTRKINWELLKIIKVLKNKGYKIALLSNNYIELRKEMENEGTIGYFDEVIVSAEVGYYKPQPEIFEILFDKLQAKNNELVFIDDKEQSLSSAKEIGYIPILYKDNKQLVKELEKLNIKL